ncbi:GDP-mannose transporter into the lumen of the Golgi [Serendipita sp. 396]|nr:GDP-mannose transporter into the lumen of the Golgi [Serendipita sp. 396]KAG8781445.1 GDP-mannose transporter into the lumen of the Golgi [Serendipita sp. 397]KAG8797770.1 GDP-mannose transporter into the lumen of the Golgi [Serendipita sp. 398]KAG8866335.1 GDP-mannose transporter into the lumen of the Golgi [Serendipita sp. 405]KAG9055614.1 GDP-mannose transporter into the lumen of the Golgi [Serendipita sp. 407]
MSNSSTPPRSPIQRVSSFHAADERGDYKQVPLTPNPPESRKQASVEVSSSPLWPIASYCLASILMTVINKFAVSGHKFNMTCVLLFIQCAVCVGCVAVFKRLRVISYRDFELETAKKWFPISSFLVILIYTGSKSLQYLSIPVYTIFKNLTIILIAYGEVIWFKGRVTGLMLVAFGLMVFSSIVASWSDISSMFTPTNGAADSTIIADAPVVKLAGLNIGYFWMFANCFSSAAYLLTMRSKIKQMGFKDWDTMFYNNLLPIPLLIITSFLIEDWSTANLSRNFPEDTRNFLLFAMALSGAATVWISYSTAWCMRTTSSTTYSMVGALNKLPVAASGMVFFGDPVNTGSVSAVLIGFFAGIVYAIAKNNQAKAEKAKEGDGVIPLANRRA